MTAPDSDSVITVTAKALCHRGDDLIECVSPSFRRSFQTISAFTKELSINGNREGMAYYIAIPAGSLGFSWAEGMNGLGQLRYNMVQKSRQGSVFATNTSMTNLFPPSIYCVCVLRSVICFNHRSTAGG